MRGDDPIHGRRHRVRRVRRLLERSRSPCADLPTRRSARPWSRLGPVLSHAAAAVVDAETATGEYRGFELLLGSYDPTSEAGRKQHRWATTVVDRHFPA